METHLIERDGARWAECAGPLEASAEAPLELISACYGHGADRLLLAAEHLPPAFFDLRTRFAGELLQKLQSYGIRLALLVPERSGHGERFDELVREARRGGRDFRAFAERAEAEAWLRSLPEREPRR